ncbi:hypothetical protein [Nocardia sp. NPDC003345]
MLLRRHDADAADIDLLTDRYRLDVVFTAVVDTTSKLAAIIAVQHLLEHDAEVVVVPHLVIDGTRTDHPWLPVGSLADLVTFAGVIERGMLGRP